MRSEKIFWTSLSDLKSWASCVLPSGWERQIWCDLSPSSSMTDCMNDSYISIDMEKLQQFWHFNWYGKTGIWMVLKYAAVSDHDIGKLK